MNDFNISIDPRGFLRVETSGDNDADFVRRGWSALSAAAESSDLRKVPGVAKTGLYLSLTDAMAHIEILAANGIDDRYRIAWVEPDPFHSKTLHFISDLLRSNALAATEIFDSEEAALSWLLGEDSH